jgi:hypothetical protein
MLRKLSAALVAVALLLSAFASGLKAANLPLVTGAAGGGCSESSQLVPCLNQTIQSINAGVNGLLSSSPTQATTTGTTIQTLGTLTINAGVLALPGQAVRVVCLGSGTATGTNTLTMQAGNATAFAIAGTATTAAGFVGELIIYKTGASTQQIGGRGQAGAVTTSSVVSGTLTDTAPINVTCSGTSTTTGNFTLNGMFMEQVK